MKARPILFSAPMVRALLAGTKTQTRRIVTDRQIDAAPPAAFFQYLREYCRYGAPGDLLWVREMWGNYRVAPAGVVYAADVDPPCGAPERWRPSIHMPRWASRLTLRITYVRVQRLQEISEEDARAEGVLCSERDPRGGELPEFPASCAEGYHWLWDSLNGADSWNANPWVWALTFEVIQQNVDAVLASKLAA